MVNPTSLGAILSLMLWVSFALSWVFILSHPIAFISKFLVEYHISEILTTFSFIVVIITLFSGTLTLIPFGTRSEVFHDWPWVTLGKWQSWLSFPSTTSISHAPAVKPKGMNALLGKYAPVTWSICGSSTEFSVPDPMKRTWMTPIRQMACGRKKIKFCWGCESDWTQTVLRVLHVWLTSKFSSGSRGFFAYWSDCLRVIPPPWNP